MKKRFVWFCLAACFLFMITGSATAQSVTTHPTRTDADKAAGKGITFKIPDGVMPLEWKDFKGMLMLYPKRPGGIFISYPNENESLNDLKVRAVTALARMFIHDDKKAGEIPWQRSSVPSHAGDKGGTAEVSTYNGEKDSLQIVVYERERNGLTLIYGHFAKKSKTSKNKDDSADFLDEKGKGSGPFDKFWKTFPE